MSVPFARRSPYEASAKAQTIDLAARYIAIRSETERLAEHLTAEDQVIQSMPDASPSKWHRAHTTWFFEAFVLCQARDYRVFDEEYAYLFNSYYEAVGPRHARAARGLLTRPGIDDVRNYRQHVDAHMLALLSSRAGEPEVTSLIELGLQHEQQHQELMLTDILHAFAQNPLLPAYSPYLPSRREMPTSAGSLSFRGGIFEIGHEGGAFAFDNETPAHDVLLGEYRLADRLVTNAEWLEFMTAGGYETPSHWLSDGRQCACEEKWRAPLYWQLADGAWRTMTLSGPRPVDLQAPVTHVSYYEADAFARWRGKRLPTEQEWEHAARSAGTVTGNFRENGYLRPLAVDGNNSQFFGDVWEWTQSAYAPYPGFRPAEGAVGEYNGKFMVNQLVLRGGSCVTAKDHIRATYRNFFYPHQRWQFSGLRLAEDPSRPLRRKLQTIPPFLEDVWTGLSATPKTLPSKYLYDAEGSRLFEAICDLPEYYLTRSESALLRVVARELSTDIEPGTTLVEFGCGACTKTRVLLDRIKNIAGYVPIDICEDSLKRSIEPLIAAFPELTIRPLAGDFAEDISLPPEAMKGPRLGFFSGSTIGNFEVEDAKDFLKRARSTLGPESRFLVAIDLAKDVDTLLLAYDDAAGVTAQFNKNLLARINRELGGNIDLDAFSHRAVWNKAMSRIEMHLLAREDAVVRVAGREFHFRHGETIHSENSHKYTLESFAEIARESGWDIKRSRVCPPPEFALVLLG